MRIAQADYDPLAGSRWLQSLTPVAQLEGMSADDRGPRVRDFDGMTPALAARAYERILNRRELDSFARDQVPVATPINGPTTTPQVPTTPQKPPKQDKPADTPRASPPGAVPTPPPAPVPPKGSENGGDDLKHLVEPPKIVPPPVSAPPPPTVPGSQGQPGITTPLPGDPLLAGNGPSVDALPMPSTEGREVEESWEAKVGDNRIKYTIPEGNGLDTVDVEVYDPENRLVSTARIVAIGGGRYVRWQDHTAGGATYYESGGPNQLGYGQHFAPGTSTSGAPSHAFETSPDLTMTRTLSIDVNGDVVGVDIGMRNSQGLYDNAHVDNFDNVTISTTRFDPAGRPVSKFTGQIPADGHGWMIDEQNRYWEGSPDADGRQSWVRVENGHTYRMDHLGVITDFSLGKDGFRLDTIYPDRSWTRQSGRTTVHFDPTGAEVWRKEIPAKPQSLGVRAWDAVGRGTSTLGGLISNTAGAPFAMMQDGLWGIASTRVDSSGTFHVTYDPPNRIAEAGKALVGLGQGTAMFYLALPRYAFAKGYDALRGSDFVRGSTYYQPPNREGQLVEDLTGFPLERWKEDTLGTAVEFGTVTAGGLLLFKAVGVKPRGNGTRPTAPRNPTLPGGPIGRWNSSLDGLRPLMSGIPELGRAAYGRALDWSRAKISKTLDTIGVGLAATAEVFWGDSHTRYAFPGGAGRAFDGPSNSAASSNVFAMTQGSGGGAGGVPKPVSSATPHDPARRAAAESLLGRHLARVPDLDDWLSAHSKKADSEFMQALFELREVARVLDRDPTLTVQTGLEFGPGGRLRVPPLPEFDLLFSGRAGNPPVRVEVTTLGEKIRVAPDLTDGIRHGLDKILKRESLGQPLARPLEVVIYGEVGRFTSTRKKGITEYYPDGAVVRKRPTGEVISTGNIFDDLVVRLNRNDLKDAGKLDRITVVDWSTGEVLVELVNVGSRWSRYDSGK